MSNAPDDVLEVCVYEQDQGLVADILLSKAGAARVADRRRRTLERRSSCGLCGVQNPQDALRAMPRLSPGLLVAPGAIQAALTALDGEQPLCARTRATHAAAWASAGGELLLVREDVGRHNALDKLIGGAARAGLDPASAFVVVTSRCSYEMVEKTAPAGVAMIVAISAPTALAVRKAEAAGMTLVALARRDGHMVFTRQSRILAPRRDCAAPDIAAFRARLVALIGERAGQEPAFIPIEADPLWAGIDSVPQSVAAQALEQGRIPPTLRQWRALKELQRFALVKLSRGGHENENFLPALDEFGLSGILKV